MACIASILAVFYWYWIKLTIFQTVGYSTIVGAVTTLIGRQALVDRASKREVVS